MYSRLRSQQSALRLLHRGLEGRLVDAVQRIAFLHPVAFLEQHRLEIAGHPGANIHAARRLDAADEFRGARDWLLLAVTTPTGTAPGVGAAFARELVRPIRPPRAPLPASIAAAGPAVQIGQS